MASSCPPSRATDRLPVPVSPETLEGRVLLSGTITAIGGTTTVDVGDINGDRFNDEVLFARTRRARVLVAIAGSLDFRPRSSLFVVDGADGSLIGAGLPFRTVGNAAPVIASGDFNEDGRQDLAVGNASRRGGIRVLLNNGDGSFDRGQLIATPSRVTGLTSADVNGDGNLDLVATVAGRGVASQLGAGTGATVAPDFRFQVQLSAGLLIPPAINGGVTAEAGGATDSFGGNNNPFEGVDTTTLIGLGNTQENVVAVSPSLTAGTFMPMPGSAVETGGSIALAGSPFGNQLIDINGEQNEAEVLVLLGNGDGTFQSQLPGRTSR